MPGWLMLSPGHLRFWKKPAIPGCAAKKPHAWSAFFPSEEKMLKLIFIHFSQREQVSTAGNS